MSSTENISQPNVSETVETRPILQVPEEAFDVLTIKTQDFQHRLTQSPTWKSHTYQEEGDK